MKTLCYFMSHTASKTAAELTCSNPYACFPKHNILGTYSLNCLQRLWNHTNAAQRKGPIHQWCCAREARVYVGSSKQHCTLSAPGKWHSSWCCRGFYLHHWDSQKPQWRSDSCCKYKGNCPSCPGRLLTFPRRGKVSVGHPKTIPISQGKSLPSYRMLWIEVGILVSWHFVKN